MSQYLSQVPIQQMQMKLEQRLTPQLIQSMEILQLPVTALEARIQEELEQNPALEADPEKPQNEPVITIGAPPKGFEEANQVRSEESRSFDRLERMTREYDFDAGDQGFYTSRRAAPSGERDAKLDALANTPARAISLQEYLIEQFALEDGSEALRRAIEVIISYVEEDGYLRTPLEVIAESVSPAIAVEQIEEALADFQQRVDPPGIGARSIQESLRLQLASKVAVNKDTYELEQELIGKYFDDLKKNRLPAIAKATGRTIEEIKEALRNVSQLDLTPGYSVVPKDVPTITPDIIVDYADDGDGYNVRLARGNSPVLRISKESKRILRDRSLDKSTRDFVRKNLESATALIDAIQYRRQRLLELARAVVERQREFFESGPQALKVFRMSELAEEFHCDPSTISRTVAGKYMQCPRGIFPLRDFFTGGTESPTGESTSWDAVKARVQQIIDEEDKSTPLSDDQIAKMLQREKLDIKRRTIAKYRQQLHIPSARQRKQF